MILTRGSIAGKHYKSAELLLRMPNAQLWVGEEEIGDGGFRGGGGGQVAGQPAHFSEALRKCL